MLEVLQFIFSSFWIWAGFTITVTAFAEAIAGVLAIIFGKKK